VPTLVLHRTGNRYIRVGNGRYLAEHIPRARLVELPGDDHFFYAGDVEAMLAPIEEFLTGARPVVDDERVLATVLFTDIVGSTSTPPGSATAPGATCSSGTTPPYARSWAAFRGREIHTTGDGFFATFDGPARAVRCALAIRGALRPLGLDIRTGLHTGECELRGDDVSGIAVHIGARVAAAANAGEVLVSGTLKDLVTGSGLRFVERGVIASRAWRESGRCTPRSSVVHRDTAARSEPLPSPRPESLDHREGEDCAGRAANGPNVSPVAAGAGRRRDGRQSPRWVAFALSEGGTRRVAREGVPYTPARRSEETARPMGLSFGDRLRRILQLRPLRTSRGRCGAGPSFKPAGIGNLEPVVAVALLCVEQILAEFPCGPRASKASPSYRSTVTGLAGLVVSSAHPLMTSAFEAVE